MAKSRDPGMETRNGIQTGTAAVDQANHYVFLTLGFLI